MPGLCIGIDIGEQNMTVCVRGRGVVSRGPSSVLVDTATGELIPTGRYGIEELRGRTPANMKVVDLCKNGVVADVELAGKVLSGRLGKVLFGRITKPNVVYAAPEDLTSVERQSIIRMLKSVGAGKVTIAPSGYAAAVGAGNALPDAEGTLTVDIGRGATKAVTVSMNKSVTTAAVRTGSGSFNDSLIKYLRRSKGVSIGEATAERIKRKVGAAAELETQIALIVSGLSVTDGRPVNIEVSSDDFLLAVEADLGAIAGCVRGALAEAPPDIAGDILARGAVLTGGGSRLRGMARFLEEETGVGFTLARHPESAVAEGLLRI